MKAVSWYTLCLLPWRAKAWSLVKQPELLVQFGQADAGGLVSVVFQRLEIRPSGLAAFLGVGAAGVKRAAAGWGKWRWGVAGQ